MPYLESEFVALKVMGDYGRFYLQPLDMRISIRCHLIVKTKKYLSGSDVVIKSLLFRLAFVFIKNEQLCLLGHCNHSTIMANEMEKQL